ncbi:MAG: tetratricopeptide repeat protein [Gemmataceae bacterium]|nr:tetratricopeptide repeat protein [Gemmataceae bacterium]
MAELQTTTQLSCPDELTLVRFVNDQLAPDDNARVEQHVESCPACQKRLNERVALHSGMIPSPPPPGGDDPPPRLDGYELLDRVAAGGMGVVWRVRDLEFGRDLALKVMKKRLCGEPGLERRFLDEAHICGRLTHPFIVPVHALGQLEDGRPYYLMKLVAGQTLATLLKGRTAPAERLMEWVQVFAQVCQAVGYAHSQGVIHRDLKPANVMIGEHGEVQMLDWGVAKMLAGTDAAAAETAPANEVLHDTRHKMVDRTEPGSALGTWAYMPPEQACGLVEEMDRRSDVFGLGTILCEILTAQPPYIGPDAESIRLQAKEGRLQGAVDRLRGCGADSELIQLAERCLAPNKADRPANAGEVAAGVQAYRARVEERLRLAEVEKARALVQAEEERKRRRLRRVGVAVVIGVLLAGVVGTTIGMIQATFAAAAAKTANEQTQRQLAQIEKGINVLASVLTDINPRNEEKGGPSLYEQLAQRASKAADELDAESVGDALAVARLQAILGTTLHELGNAHKAIAMLEKARATCQRELGADHPDTLNTLNNLAGAYRAAGRLPEAIKLYEQVRDAQVKKPGADHPTTLTTLNNLALAYRDADQLPEAINLLEQVRDALMKKLGADHPSTLLTLNNLAGAYQDAGRLPEAIKLHEQVRDAQVNKLGIDHPDTLTNLANLALAYREAARLPEAIKLFEQVRDAQMKKLGADHHDTFTTLHNLALAFQDARRLPEAINLLEQVRDSQLKKVGADHPSTFTTLDNLAGAYREAARLPEAIKLFEQVRDGRVKKLGLDHPDTLTTLHKLAAAYHAARRLPDAIKLFEQVRDGRVKKLGKYHHNTLTTLAYLALAYADARRLPEAIKLYEQVRDAQVKKLGADHPTTLTTLHNLAVAYREAGRPPEAIKLLKQVRDARVNRLGADHPDTLTTFSSLAVAYRDDGKLDEALPLFEQAVSGVETRHFLHEHAGVIIAHASSAYVQAGQFDKAEAWQRKWLAMVKQRDGADSLSYADGLAVLGLNLLMQKKWAEAEKPLRETLAVREKKSPDAWTTFNAKSMLGGALLGQKKHAEAEPLLLDGYQGMKKRQKSISPQGQARLVEAVDRLIGLYTALDRPDEVKTWQAERDRLAKQQKAPEKK